MQVVQKKYCDSTSATTGALRVDGGVGIAKDLYVGGGKIEIGSEGSKSIVKMADDAEIQTLVVMEELNLQTLEVLFLPTMLVQLN